MKATLLFKVIKERRYSLPTRLRSEQGKSFSFASVFLLLLHPALRITGGNYTLLIGADP
jgi:hypothetical protein